MGLLSEGPGFSTVFLASINFMNRISYCIGSNEAKNDGLRNPETAAKVESGLTHQIPEPIILRILLAGN